MLMFGLYLADRFSLENAPDPTHGARGIRHMAVLFPKGPDGTAGQN